MKSLTQKDLSKITGCRPYLIRYYFECGYLPVERESTGPGDPVLYHPDAVEVIRERMARRQPQAAEECGAGSLDGPGQ